MLLHQHTLTVLFNLLFKCRYIKFQSVLLVEPIIFFSYKLGFSFIFFKGMKNMTLM